MELLVPRAAGHEQKGVVLARGHAGAVARRVLSEHRPVGHDHPAGGRDDGAPRGDHLVQVVGRQARVGDEHRHLSTGGDDLLGDGERLVRVAGGAKVVVAAVAAELVGEELGVLGRHQDQRGR